MANCDNPRRGAAFELAVQDWLGQLGIVTSRNFIMHLGAASERRPRKFDLGSANPLTLVECKCHTWTDGGNAPSAKLTVWNESMHYFACAPREYRKLLVVLRSVRAGEGLAAHYVRRYSHLVPAGVELWEFDDATRQGVQLFVGK